MKRVCLSVFVADTWSHTHKHTHIYLDTNGCIDSSHYLCTAMRQQAGKEVIVSCLFSHLLSLVILHNSLFTRQESESGDGRGGKKKTVRTRTITKGFNHKTSRSYRIRRKYAARGFQDDLFCHFSHRHTHRHSYMEVQITRLFIH